MLANAKVAMRRQRSNGPRRRGQDGKYWQVCSAGEKVNRFPARFLVDSETSLSGSRCVRLKVNQRARPVEIPTIKPPAEFEAIKSGAVTLFARTLPALKWPADDDGASNSPKPGLLRGFKKGDRVTFRFMQMKTGSTINQL